MAADKKQQPNPDEDLFLDARDVLGIMQRSLWELSHYISQPAVNVDPRVIMTELHRAAAWTARLPLPQVAQGQGAEARAN